MWKLYVVRSVTSLHPSSVLQGTITILCMIVAVTGAHGELLHILVHKSTIRNCWKGWRGAITWHPFCTSVALNWNYVYTFLIQNRSFWSRTTILTYHKGILDYYYNIHEPVCMYLGKKRTFFNGNLMREKQY